MLLHEPQIELCAAQNIFRTYIECNRERHIYFNIANKKLDSVNDKHGKKEEEDFREKQMRKGKEFVCLSNFEGKCGLTKFY